MGRFLRLKALFRRQKLERDLDDELAFHLAMKAEKLGEQASFGNATRIKEICRDLWTFPWIESVWKDLGYGLRVLRRSPLFTAVAVLSLALGIGANTAIFTVVNGMLLEKLPVPEPDRLISLEWSAKEVGGISASEFTDFPNVFFDRIRTDAKELWHVFAFAGLRRVALTLEGRADSVDAMLVSGDYFGGLGVRPAIGRLLAEADDKPSALPAAVISYELWRDVFGRDSRAVGASAKLNGVPLTIVGVTPHSYYGVSATGDLATPAITIPLSLASRIDPRRFDGARFADPAQWWLNLMGRLRPGATIASAQAETGAIFRQTLLDAKIDELAKVGLPALHVLPGARGLGDFSARHYRELLSLWSLTGLVLLAACANVATLLLARARTRLGEVAVRQALGASRPRLLRQFLTEGVLLSLAAGVLGMLFSLWASPALLALANTGGYPVRLAMRPGVPVLGFVAGLSILTGILFSLAPALRAGRTGNLRSPQRAGDGGWGQGFIVVQVALSLVLAVSAGLFVRTLQNLRHVNVGFRTEGLLLFGLDPPEALYTTDRRLGLYRKLLARLQATPGVVSASASSNRLLSGGMSFSTVLVPGAERLRKGRLGVALNKIGPQFFETMGIPLLLGRGPSERDAVGAARVAFLNKAMAERAFPGVSPLGRAVVLGKERFEIAGVVADARYDRSRKKPPLTLYLPYEQTDWGRKSLDFVVRTYGKPEALTGVARDLVRKIDPNLPLLEVRTQQQVIDEQLMTERVFAGLSTGGGIVALLLACIGIYGVVAYSAARRTAEIGIRMALGARFGDVIVLVLRRTVILIAVGVAAGAAGALAATRLVASILYDVAPRDPATFIGSAALLILTAIAAGYIPARKAARIDPMTALRCE